MTTEHSILEAIRCLPPDKQQQLLEYAEHLKAESQSKMSFKSMKGLWADLDVCLSAEEIDELRKDMWKSFPRDDF